MKRQILTFFGLNILLGAAVIAARPMPPMTNLAETFLKPFTSAKPVYDEFDDLIKDAFDLYKQKKYDEALALCAKATEMRPTDFRPHYVKGAVYMAQWKMKSASDEFATAISLNADNKRLYLLKATADRMRNAREESVAASRKAIALDKNYAEAYAMLADALSIGDKDIVEAIQSYRTAIKLKPDMFSAYEQLGMHLAYAQKDEKGAEEVYRKAMESDPKHMACRFNLGRLLVKQERLVEARTLWNERTSDQDNTFPHFIDLLTRAEKLKQATDTLAQKPNDPDALLQMGLMVLDGESWVVDGRQDRAITYFRKALAAKPGFAGAQYAIVKAYIEAASTFKDKNKNVDEELAKLRKLDPKLADEMTEYRKSYSSGISTGGTLNQ